jgi:hypothetical protein
MSDAFHAFFVLAGACFAAMCIGGSFAFGVASVCRWMKWAPLNTTINVNNYGEAVGYGYHDPVGGPREP